MWQLPWMHVAPSLRDHHHQHRRRSNHRNKNNILGIASCCSNSSSNSTPAATTTTTMVLVHTLKHKSSLASLSKSKTIENAKATLVVVVVVRKSLQLETLWTATTKTAKGSSCNGPPAQKNKQRLSTVARPKCSATTTTASCTSHNTRQCPPPRKRSARAQHHHRRLRTRESRRKRLPNSRTKSTFCCETNHHRRRRLSFLDREELPLRWDRRMVLPRVPW